MYVALCNRCSRQSPRLLHDAAQRWKADHVCRRLSDAEARELRTAGAALAYTRDLGWHLITAAEVARVEHLAEHVPA